MLVCPRGLILRRQAEARETLQLLKALPADVHVELLESVID